MAGNYEAAHLFANLELGRLFLFRKIAGNKLANPERALQLAVQE
jgi:hypothetical protein